jgi:quaternary ammonium compound-resistance protein SugE
LPVGTAYVVWIGIGAVGTVLGGILLFDEPVTVHRLAFLILVIIGVIGLKTTINT